MTAEESLLQAARDFMNKLAASYNKEAEAHVNDLNLKPLIELGLIILARATDSKGKAMPLHTREI